MPENLYDELIDRIDTIKSNYRAEMLMSEKIIQFKEEENSLVIQMDKIKR